MQTSNSYFRSLIIFLFFSTIQLKAQVHADGFLGVLLNDNHQTVGLDLAIGRQANKRLGYGLNLRTMYAGTVSTSNTFSMIGAQYRLLDNKHRFYGKIEAGSLLNAKFGTDTELRYEYESKFAPYYRLYIGYRLGKFTIGLNYTYIAPFSESIYDYDENTGAHFFTNQYRTRDFHNLQVHFGFSFDSYKVVRRR